MVGRRSLPSVICAGVVAPVTPCASPALAAAWVLTAAILTACGAKTGLDELGHEREPPPEGCVVEPEGTTTVLDEDAPGFVRTLAPLISPPGHYVIGATVGWSGDEHGRLIVIDEDLHFVAQRAVAGVEAPQVAQGEAGSLIVSYEADDAAWLALYTISPGGVPSDVPSQARLICERTCFPAAQPPVPGPEGYLATVPLERYADESANVVLVPADPDEPTVAGELVPDAEPRFVRPRDGDGMLFVATTSGALEAYRLSPLGQIVERLDWSVEVAFRGTGFGVAETGDGSFVVAFPSPEGMALTRVGAPFGASGVLVLDPESGMPSNVSVSVSGSTAAVVWGEGVGLHRVGAHLVVLDLDDLSIQWGPGLLGPDLERSASSSTIWAAVAPASDGHVVVWNAWQPDVNYAIHARRVRCRR